MQMWQGEMPSGQSLLQNESESVDGSHPLVSTEEEDDDEELG